MPAEVVTYEVICLILFILSFAGAVGLFALLLFKRRAKKSLTLFSVGVEQELTEAENPYFSSISYNEKLNAIMLKNVGEMKKCVVTVVYKNEKGSVKMHRYDCIFNEKYVTSVKMREKITEYRVIIESVDTKIVKHPSIDNHLLFNIIYGVAIAAIHATAVFIYVIMCSYFLRDYWAAYDNYYFLAITSISFALVSIGGYVLVDFLSKKGVI